MEYRSSFSLALALSMASISAASHEVAGPSCPTLRCTDEVINVKAAPFGAVGNGIADDTAAIQAAIDAGSTVLVPSGTYLLSLDYSNVALHIKKSHLQLILSAGAMLRLKDSQISMTRDGQIIQIGDGIVPIDGVSVVGSGSIDGNRATNTGNGEVTAGIQLRAGATGIVIRDIMIFDMSGDAILMNGSPTSRIDDVLVEGVHLEDCDEGILWKFADHVRVLGSHLKNIDVQDGIEPHEDSQQWIIANSTIDGVPNGQGIDPFAGARYGLIMGNTIRNAQQGMDLTSGGTYQPVSDVLVTGNVIQGATREGLFLPGNDAKTDTRIVITNNIVTGTLLNGISIGTGLKGIRIVGNQITDTKQFKGIVIETGSEVDVIDNLISDSGFHGLHHRGSNSRVTGNVVKNNSRALPGQFPAIQLDGGDGVTCTGNSAYDDQAIPTQQSGIWVRSSDTLVEYNSGFGNIGGLITDERRQGTVIRNNSGWTTENEGVAVFSGDGTTVTFQFAHGLVCKPSVVFFAAKSADAASEKYWTADAASIVMTFKRAPRAGTDNVSFSWRATCE